MTKKFDTDLNQRLSDPEFKKEFGSELSKTEIAVTLTSARLATGTTQVDLAKKLGTSQSYIAKLERGDANPTIGMIGKVLASMDLRLKANTESIVRDTSPRIFNYQVGENYTWDFIWAYETCTRATNQTDPKQYGIVAVGGNR
ncbi:helix-turn-helix domain-containing protein [Chloroflexota bacterium]